MIPRPFEFNAVDGATVRLDSGAGVSVSHTDLDGFADRFVDDVRRDCDFALQTRSTPAAITFRLTSDTEPGTTRETGAPTPRGISPTGAAVDESYRLTVGASGAVVESPTPTGIFRGATTLRQLIAAARHVEGGRELPAVDIADSPRFSWRGLSLDVVRTFHSPDVLRDVIDICALYKLNLLHLHLTDDQGWRIEIPAHPVLTAIGAAGAIGDRPGGYYTVGEFSALVTYAAERFVTIVPEIDMPGHCGAVLRARPDLMSDALGPSVLDPDNPAVLELVRDVIDAVSAITPGPFLHVGGDEAFGMPDDSYAKFLDASRRYVTDAGKRVVGWQEIARAGVDSSDVVQFWLASGEQLLNLDDPPPDSPIPSSMIPVIREMFAKAKADLANAVAKGARVVVSPSTHVYLDTPYREPSSDAAQDQRQRDLGLMVYPRRTIRESWDWDPDRIDGLPPSQVAGIEAAIWCETISSAPDLEFMLLPRLAAVAEKGWSVGTPLAWEDYRTRLAGQATLWASRGWEYFASCLIDWERS